MLAALIGVPLAAGAGAGVVLAALLVAAVARDERVGVEAATAVAVSGCWGSEPCWRSRPRARSAWRSCCSATC